jgi:ABC-type branched-subunit amino acid transport system ATPase component
VPNYLITVGMLMFFTAFIGQSWNVSGGFAGQTSFGHAVFFGVGAYTSTILHVSHGWNPWLAWPVATAMGGLVGAGIAFLSFRAGLRGSYFALITLAFAEVFRIVANRRASPRGGLGMLIKADSRLENFQFKTPIAPYYLALALCLVSLLIAWWLTRSRFGARLVAIRENEDAARALGIDVFAEKGEGAHAVGAMCAAGRHLLCPEVPLHRPRPSPSASTSRSRCCWSPWSAARARSSAADRLDRADRDQRADPLGRRVMPALKNVQPLSLIVYGAMLIIIVARLPDGFASLLGAAAMLEVRDLSKAFGGLKAVDQRLARRARRARSSGLIGPNGAGKTTLFAAIAGFHKPDGGRIGFEGRDITGLEPHRICAAGMVRTFQITQPFARISVRENIMVGAYFRTADRRSAARQAEAVAAQVGMADQLDQQGADLTVAGRKRLELARALATGPRLLLLDEVMAGLNPTEIGEIVAVIRSVRASGVTILLIEHVMQAVTSLAERVYVLNQGRMIAEGTPAAIADNPEVIEAYLGHGAARVMRA